jgi:hypothetical protein
MGVAARIAAVRGRTAYPVAAAPAANSSREVLVR